MRALRSAAHARAGGRCEVSGYPLGAIWDLHHRRNKGMGGTRRADTDTLANVLCLRPEVHNSAGLASGGWRGPSVHGSRSWSEPLGYLLPKNAEDLSLWPVRLHGLRWVLLGVSGGYVELDYSGLP
jgi:hypothetical protein